MCRQNVVIFFDNPISGGRKNIVILFHPPGIRVWNNLNVLYIYMLPETVDLYAKYRFFLYLLSNERLMLFHKNKNELDYENFFDLYNWVIHKHWQIKPLYKIFRTRRAAIIKNSIMENITSC